MNVDDDDDPKIQKNSSKWKYGPKSIPAYAEMTCVSKGFPFQIAPLPD
jgi:hypothetical protein